LIIRLAGRLIGLGRIDRWTGGRLCGTQQRRGRGVAYVGHVALNSGTAT